MKFYDINHTRHTFSDQVQKACELHVQEMLVRIEGAFTDTANNIRGECTDEVMNMHLDHYTPEDLERLNEEHQVEFMFQDYVHEQLMLLVIKKIGERNCQLETDFIF